MTFNVGGVRWEEASPSNGRLDQAVGGEFRLIERDDQMIRVMRITDIGKAGKRVDELAVVETRGVARLFVAGIVSHEQAKHTAPSAGWLEDYNDETLVTGAREMIHTFETSGGGHLNSEVAVEVLRELANRLDQRTLADAGARLLNLRARVAE